MRFNMESKGLKGQLAILWGDYSKLITKEWNKLTTVEEKKTE